MTKVPHSGHWVSVVSISCNQLRGCSQLLSSCKIQCKREIKQTKANICFVQIKTHSKNNHDYYLSDITEKDFPIFLYFYVLYIFKQQYNLSETPLYIFKIINVS